MTQSRSFFGPLVFLGLLGLSIAIFARMNIDSVATRFVNSTLSQWLAGSGFSASVGEAIFFDGRGFELRDIELRDHAGNAQKLLTIDSAFVAIPTQISDLVSLECRPTAVEIRRAEFSVTSADFKNPRIRELLAILQQRKSNYDLIPIHIRDSTFTYKSKADQPGTHLSDVNLDLIPDESHGNRILRLAVQSEGQHVRRLEAEGLFDLENELWQLEFDRVAGTCDFDLINLLPLKLECQACNLKGATGRVSVTGIMRGSFDSCAKPDFQFKCQIDNFSVHNESIPVPLQNCRALLNINNDGFTVERAEGHVGDGKFNMTYRQRGLQTRRAWTSSGSFSNMLFQHKLLALLPFDCTSFCRDYSPAGIYDMQFEINSSGYKNVTAQLKDMSFNFRRFPFQLDHCVGNVSWVNDKLDFKIQTLEQGQLLKFEGRVTNPGTYATYVFHFGSDGRLPIDNKFLNSLQHYPSMDKAFRDFRPVGFVNGHGTIRKMRSGSDFYEKDIRIDFHDCRVNHKSFSYPMQNVRGTVHLTHEGFTFQNVTGSNSSGQAACRGIWNQRDGLRLEFQCHNVKLDDRLRNALIPSLQEVWDGLRPDGKVRVGSVFLDYLPGAHGPDIRVQASLGDQTMNSDQRSASIYPASFPYRIENIQGDIEIGNGEIKLTDILGRHGDTWMTCDGTGQYSGTQWKVNLENLLAGSVKPDEELINAFPDDLATALRKLKYDGQMNINGAISFAGNYDQANLVNNESGNATIRQVAFNSTVNQATSIDWDLRLDIDQAAMIVGVPLENIFGSLRISGRYNGEFAQCRGEVALDSVNLYGMQITNVSGPIYIDDKQTLAGKFASQSTEESTSLSGNLFGGQIVFDGWVSHENKYPFFLQTTVEKSNLRDLAGEITPDMAELSGDAYGFLRLRGNAEELHTFSGNGNVHLRNAKIHQLPVILALLKILSVKEVTRTAFDTSNVDFTVKGDRIRLGRIELIGDAISLIGNGYLELFRYADINFYSVVGRNRIYIPLISELYQAGSRRIMWINVGGPMDNLQTTRRVLPGINDSIRALFENDNLAPAGSTNALNQRRAPKMNKGFE